MTKTDSESIAEWAGRHALCVWLGIGLNLALVFPLLFYPTWILGILGLPLNQLIWGRFSAWLLLLLSLFYVPATIDLRRYRANAWLAIFPSRTGGALFFFIAVFVFKQPPGFLVGTLLDASVGFATLYCLIKVHTLERQQAEGRAVAA